MTINPRVPYRTSFLSGVICWEPTPAMCWQSTYVAATTVSTKESRSRRTSHGESRRHTRRACQRSADGTSLLLVSKLAGSFLIAALLLLPTPALSQPALAGIVRDSSGAILPGVTVEAASPALIEKSRTVVTDGTGQYRIV